MDDDIIKDAFTNLMGTAHAMLSPENYLLLNIVLGISRPLINTRYQERMSVEEFADYLGVDSKDVTEWEAGQHNFTLKEISEIFSKLGLDIEIKVTKEDKKTDDA